MVAYIVISVQPHTARNAPVLYIYIAHTDKWKH